MLPAMLSAASIAHSPWSGQVPPPRILPRALTGPALRLAALQDECPAGCTRVGPGPVVHGDPMFKINGTGTHFWLKEGGARCVKVVRRCFRLSLQVAQCDRQILMHQR